MAEYITKKIRDLNDFTQINPMTTGDHLVVASSEGTPSTNKATIKDVVGLYLESSSGAGKWSDGVIAGDIYYNAGNVGIGTTSPAQPLEINIEDNSAYANGANANALRLRNHTVAAANSYIGLELYAGNQTVAGVVPISRIYCVKEDNTTTASALTFATRKADSVIHERMRIDSVGNVGIGTSSPVFKLDVADHITLSMGSDGSGNRPDLTSKTSRVGGVHYNNQTNPVNMMMHYCNSTENNLYVGWGTSAMVCPTKIVFGTAPNTNTDSSTISTKRMVIDGNGNVGIGTTNPSAVFECKKNATGPVHLGRFTNANGQAIVQIKAKNDNLSILEFADSEDGNVGAINYSHAANYMRFKTSDVERVAIDSSGRVGIGTTDPQAALHIERSDDTVVHSKITNTSTAVNSIGASVIEGLRSAVLQLTCFSAGTDAKSFNISSQSGLLTIDLISDDGSTATRLLDLDTNGNLRIKGTLTQNATF